MRQEKYVMKGNRGTPYLLINGHAVAYADEFIAGLTENIKEFPALSMMFAATLNCTAKLLLRGLSSPHPDSIRAAIEEARETGNIDLAFKGFYKNKSDDALPVKFSRLIPLNCNIDDFVDGYVDKLEFEITYLDDDTIGKFKTAKQ